MQDLFAIAKSSSALGVRRESMAKGGSEVDVAVREFFQPYVLAFLALAVLFGGWSYGYKLSQYLQHPEVTRASLTRAWVDHRQQAIQGISEQQHLQPRVVELEPSSAASLRTPERTPDFVLDEPAPAREAFLFSSLIPFRAPPSTDLSLA